MKNPNLLIIISIPRIAAKTNIIAEGIRCRRLSERDIPRKYANELVPFKLSKYLRSF
jgi:hypothetical protein